jgi:DNA polymerase III alpha subunit
MPDIDIDFDMNRRGEVIEYVTRKYGPEQVAQIITFNTMAAKAVIKDVGPRPRYPVRRMQPSRARKMACRRPHKARQKGQRLSLSLLVTVFG